MDSIIIKEKYTNMSKIDKKKIFHTLFSGFIGSLLTIIIPIIYQHFFELTPSYTFIIEGKEVKVTKSEMQKQLNTTEDKLNNIQNDLNSKADELNLLKQEINEKKLINVNYKDFQLNNNGEIKNEYKNGIVNIDGKDYVLFNILNELTNEEIKYEDNILYIGNSTNKIVDLMSVRPPYDTSGNDTYNINPFKMGGDLYDGFSIKSGYYSESYVLINLKNEFSNLEFDFGHVDGSSNYECTLNIYIDEKLIDSIDYKPDSKILHKNIPLNYAEQLKIGVSGNWVEYGFGNIKLQY